jgi:hypothetical protein
MKIEQLTTKLDRIYTAHRAKQLKYARDYFSEATDPNGWEVRSATRCLESANDKRAGLAMRFYPRLTLFKAHSDKLIFNPLTGHGTSYQWYDIAKVIKGKQVLNTYGYSAMTSQHVSKLHALLVQLGIKFVELEAPQGLQNLDAAARHHMDLLACRLVREKYARKKSPARITKGLREKLALVKRLGGKLNGYTLKQALENAEQSRRSKLDWAKERKARRAETVAKLKAEADRYAQYEAESYEYAAAAMGAKPEPSETVAPTLRLVKGE